MDPQPATKLLWEVLGQLHLCGGDMLMYEWKPLELWTEVPLAGVDNGLHAPLVKAKNLNNRACPPLMIRKQSTLHMQRDLLWVTCRIPSAVQFARDESYNEKNYLNWWRKCWTVSSVTSFRAGICHSRKRNPTCDPILSRLIWNSRIVSELQELNHFLASKWPAISGGTSKPKPKNSLRSSNASIWQHTEASGDTGGNTQELDGIWEYQRGTPHCASWSKE